MSRNNLTSTNTAMHEICSLFIETPHIKNLAAAD